MDSLAEPLVQTPHPGHPGRPIVTAPPPLPSHGHLRGPAPPLLHAEAPLNLAQRADAAISLLPTFASSYGGRKSRPTPHPRSTATGAATLVEVDVTLDLQIPTAVLPADLLSNLFVTPGPQALPAVVKACTTTLSITDTDPCEWHGTLTVYPSTSTKYQGVDCNGCSDVFVKSDVWFCPYQNVDATRTVATPRTVLGATCNPSTVYKRIFPTPAAGPSGNEPTFPYYRPLEGLGPGVQAARPTPHGLQVAGAASCPHPTTLVVPAPQSAGKTLTGYSRFTTTTKQLDCNGCPLVVSTMVQGPGPIAHFTTTTTLPLGTATAYVCAGFR